MHVQPQWCLKGKTRVLLALWLSVWGAQVEARRQDHKYSDFPTDKTIRRRTQASIFLMQTCKGVIEVFDSQLFILACSRDETVGHQTLPAWSLWRLLSRFLHLPPSVSVFQLGTLNQLESKQHCTQWLLIKSQTVLSYIAPVGLGSRKERARLDRSCFFFFTSEAEGMRVARGGQAGALKASR